VRPPALTIDTASAMARVELLPTLVVGFYGIFRINASVALRVQADLDYATTDAVLCDVPYCGEAGFPLYVTWQPRLVVAVSDLRLRDLAGKIPLVGKLADKFIQGDMRLIKESEVVNKPLTPRKRLLGVCLPIPRYWTMGPNLQWASYGRSLALASAAVMDVPLPPAPTRCLRKDSSLHVPRPVLHLPAAAEATRQLELATRQLQTWPEGTVYNVPEQQHIGYDLVKGSSQVFSLYVEDSTVPVTFHLLDDGKIYFFCPSVSIKANSDQRLEVFVEPPSWGLDASDDTGLFKSVARWTDYGIDPRGTWRYSYAMKQAQGFGHSGSYYYIRWASHPPALRAVCRHGSML